MDTDFAATNETDYRELGALISLLDIAVDDARSIDLDLTDRETEKQFDADVERFALAIKDIMRSIGTPGPGFISKIEAKELLELVSQRIGDILRSRPKLKQGIFAAPPPKDDDLGKEKSGMAKFLSRKTAGPAKHPVLNIAAG
jgi:hypothetical protein